jgi:hypothetical protein
MRKPSNATARNHCSAMGRLAEASVGVEVRRLSGWAEVDEVFDIGGNYITYTYLLHIKN